MDVLWALLLIGVGIFVGGILLRRVPATWLGLGAVIVVFGLGIPALVIDDNKTETASGSGAEGQATGGGDEGGGAAETGGGGGESAAGGAGGGASEEGKLIFTQSCGTCHVLSDAGTNGQVGPNLDELKPDKARVEAAIKNGGSGSGTMPANIVTGAEAEAVADYVASAGGG